MHAREPCWSPAALARTLEPRAAGPEARDPGPGARVTCTGTIIDGACRSLMLTYGGARRSVMWGFGGV